MSYDLMVFEKSGVSLDRTEFLDWLNETMEKRAVEDIFCVSDRLQEFFHSVRHIFPPMNGVFAPDDKQLSEYPQMEDYLCDYSICEGMIYLSFAYSVAEFAYDTVKRAAYFAGIGFFNPSDDSSQPVLFDSRGSMLLEGEWFRPIEVDRFDEISAKLDRMTAKNRSYLYLTDQIGNYIQIGGCRDAFTVEKRVYTDAVSYVHMKAGYSGMEQADKAGEVWIAGNRVNVRQSQMLGKEAAKQLFLDFFQNTETAESIMWSNMDV